MGLPLDVTIMQRDTMEVVLNHRIGEDDPYFHMVSRQWGQSLTETLRGMPNPSFEDAGWQPAAAGTVLPDPAG